MSSVQMGSACTIMNTVGRTLWSDHYEMLCWGDSVLKTKLLKIILSPLQHLFVNLSSKDATICLTKFNWFTVVEVIHLPCIPKYIFYCILLSKIETFCNWLDYWHKSINMSMSGEVSVYSNHIFWFVEISMLRQERPLDLHGHEIRSPP